MVISFEEVLKEIEDLNKKVPEGFSTAEMSEALGHTQEWCRYSLRKMIAAGKVRCNGRKSVPRIDGYMTDVPVYVFIDCT
jgi:DNA-binding Lrp family transcriptional regulator